MRILFRISYPQPLVRKDGAASLFYPPSRWKLIFHCPEYKSHSFAVPNRTQGTYKFLSEFGDTEFPELPSHKGTGFSYKKQQSQPNLARKFTEDGGQEHREQL